MAMAEFLKDPKTKVIASAVALLLAAGIFMATSTTAPVGPPEQAYYYDLNTGKVFTASAKSHSPIQTDSGAHADNLPAGRKIYIFSCGGCGQYDGKTLDEIRADGAIPGWLEMFTAEAKNLLEQGSTSTDIIMAGQLIKDVDGGRWMSQMTSTASNLISNIRQACNGSEPNPCHP